LAITLLDGNSPTDTKPKKEVKIHAKKKDEEKELTEAFH